MTTKEYLLQVKKINDIIKNRMHEIDDLRSMSRNISSVAYDRDRVQSSGSVSKLENIVTRIVDLDRQVDNYIDLKYKIIKQIESLDADEYSVLYMRFVNGYTFGTILSMLNEEDVWSERKMYHVYSRALESFERKFGELYESV